MIRYPALVAAVAGLDLDALADRASTDIESLAAILDGKVAASPAMQRLIAGALHRRRSTLFALDADLEPALAAAPGRYVTDPATLRMIDDRPRPAA